MWPEGILRQKLLFYGFPFFVATRFRKISLNLIFTTCFTACYISRLRLSPFTMQKESESFRVKFAYTIECVPSSLLHFLLSRFASLDVCEMFKNKRHQKVSVNSDGKISFYRNVCTLLKLSFDTREEDWQEFRSTRFAGSRKTSWNYLRQLKKNFNSIINTKENS